MHWGWIGLVVLVGALLPIQAGANAKMAGHAGGFLQASIVNFLVGFAGIIGVCLATRASLPQVAEVARAPWWAWVGGLCGATLVASSALLAPRLGVAVFLAALIAGQMIASLIVDHFGLVGLAERTITPGKIAGVAFLIVGVGLIKLA